MGYMFFDSRRSPSLIPSSTGSFKRSVFACFLFGGAFHLILRVIVLHRRSSCFMTMGKSSRLLRLASRRVRITIDHDDAY